ncbi:hypothetical protein LB520_07365 [Mesorhizobium sp. CA12]|nr:hypothetical protein [Mesorhizobium sp. CA12]
MPAVPPFQGPRSSACGSRGSYWRGIPIWPGRRAQRAGVLRSARPRAA